MFKQAGIAAGYAGHFLSSVNEHGIHSPFLYKLITECIYSDDRYPQMGRIEKIRQQLKCNNSIIHVTDLGAGSRFDGIQHTRTVAKTVNQFAKSRRLCRLLYRLTRYMNPHIMIELGTSLGISAMYQAAGNPSGKLYTIEGCKETFSHALAGISDSGIDNIRCINGSFDDKLPEILADLDNVDWAYIDGNHTEAATMRYFKILSEYSNDSTVLVFDDINWSQGMRSAWQRICNDVQVTMTVNLFFMGLVFFNKDLSKQDFKIRF